MYPLPFLSQLESVHPPTLIFPISSTTPSFWITFSSKALEEKVIQKDGVVEDIGKINVGGWTLSNWDKKGNGYIDYPKVLQVSSNVGMVKIMQNLDPTIYWDWPIPINCGV